MDGQGVFIWEGGTDCLVKPVHCFVYIVFFFYCFLVLSSVWFLLTNCSIVDDGSEHEWVATKSQYENGTFSKENLVI